MIREDLIYETVSRKIRELRQRHPVSETKITQRALAEEIGIDRSTLTNIEIGNQRPPLHVIYAICAYFDVPLSEFLPSLSSVLEHSSSEKIVVGDSEHEVQGKTGALLKERYLRRGKGAR